MNRELLVFLAMCALAAAMVPRFRRAVHSEEEDGTTTESHDTQRYCEYQTPCAWSVYEPGSKHVEINITNTYCICPSDLNCKVSEDDTASSSYVYRCRKHNEEEA